jgi:serine O-acetyltransferase
MNKFSVSNSKRFHLLSFLKDDILRFKNASQALNSKLWLNRYWISLFSPRVLPVFLCRLAFFFAQYNLAFASKFFSFLNFIIFGIEISTKTFIDRGLLLPHTQGTVLGASYIGKNATIFQGVTLGSKFLDFNNADRPQIGENVLIGAGAKVLGSIMIGNNVKIGSNAVVLKTIHDNCIAIGIPAKQFKKNN